MNKEPSSQGIWKVIGASSVGTLIEWYDFYIFGSLATVIASQFFPKTNPTAALLSTLATFAAGFIVRPIWRAGVRKVGRYGWKEIYFPAYAGDHGWFNVCYRTCSVI
jgi:hypothetical protein